MGLNRAAPRIVVLLAALWLAPAAPAADHAMAMHGEPKYGPDFAHFDYVNPEAPTGGSLRQWTLGTFNSLNPFILKGEPAAALGNTFDSLAVQSADEPFTMYGLIAETMEVADDRRSVTFTLRPEARFQDGKPITPADVIFTFNTLVEQGNPLYRVYYGDVTAVERTGEREVTFRFRDERNAELPLILAQLDILPAHHFEDRPFNESSLEPLLGSGPYRVAEVEAGRFVTLERVPDYWAADLPVNVGRHNFDRLRVEYFRDTNAAMEAFKAGRYDVREEHVSKIWSTGYDFPAVERGLVNKELLPHQIPQGMQGFFMNTRRPPFDDRRVREALGYALDFQWINQTLFYGAYQRIESYFSNSELAAEGLPGPAQLALLEPFAEALPPEVLERAWQAPTTNGENGLRRNLRQASRMLTEAGWVVRDGKRVHEDTGAELAFEILNNQATMERVMNPFVENLKRLGIDARIRTVDASQYQNRMEQFDFDMTTLRYGQSTSPGNELWDRFGAAAADTPGSSNYAGVADPVVDALIKQVVQADSREALVEASRALDRVLLFGHYAIPHWYLGAFRLAWWDRFGRPETRPAYSLGLDTWWLDPERNARVQQALGSR